MNTLFFFLFLGLTSCTPVSKVFVSIPNAFSHAKAFGNILHSICEERPNFVIFMHNHTFGTLQCSVTLLPSYATSNPDFGEDFPYNDKVSFEEGMASLFAKTQQLAWEEYLFWDNTFTMHANKESVLIADANSFAAIAAANKHSIPVFCHTPNNLFDVSYFPSPFPYSGLSMWDLLGNLKKHLWSERLHDIVLKKIVVNTGITADKLYQKTIDVRYTALIDLPTLSWGNVRVVSPIFMHRQQPKNYGPKLLVSFGTLVYPLEPLIDTIVSDLVALSKENPDTEITWIAPTNFKQIRDKVEGYDCFEVKQWADIQASLCGGNYSLYITHGGHNSIMESLYCGVPIIVTPLNFDQLDNAYRVEYHGFGMSLSRNLSKGTLLKAVNDIKSDDIYRKNLNRASLILKDQPLASNEAKKVFFSFIHQLQSPGIFQSIKMQLAGLYGQFKMVLNNFL